MLSIFGVRIDDISHHELKKLLEEWLGETKPHLIFTPNPEFLLLARQDAQFAALINQSDLSLPDGVGVQFASFATAGKHLPHRQTGTDTLLLLARLCEEHKKRLLLLGGGDKTATDAACVLQKQYTGLDVVAFDPGFLTGNFLSLSIPAFLVKKIQNLKPDIMAVALGQGKQERFLIEMSSQLPTVKIGIGVGGALDMISGRLRRAPVWMRRSGLEWLWRVIIEPKRIRRTFRAAVIFPIRVIWDILKQRL